MRTQNGLTVYESSSVTWTRREFVLDALLSKRRGITSIIRYARLPRLHRYEDVHDVLDAADTTFNSIARICGIRIVEHDWGVSEIPRSQNPDTTERLSSEYLPPGMSLVARVAIIHDWAELNYEQYKPIGDALDAISLPNKWHDDGIDQFMLGRQGDGSRAIYLHDIEPLVSPNVPNSA